VRPATIRIGTCFYSALAPYKRKGPPLKTNNHCDDFDDYIIETINYKAVALTFYDPYSCSSYPDIWTEEARQ